MTMRDEYPALKNYLDFYRRPAIEIYADKSPPPLLFATTAKPLALRIWNGHGSDPEFRERPLAVGTPVKIVMASRFGDVGITDDLNAETGYHLRVMPEDGYLRDYREVP
jgi:hypothetical protein